MTPEELEAALARGAWVSAKKTSAPNPLQPLGVTLGCSDAHALTIARARGLIDADGWLHCWHCKEATDWHVSLHCPGCRASSPARKREQDRREREQRAEEQRRQEPSPPAQRVGGRSFREDY